MATTTGGFETVVLPSDRALLPPPPPPRNRAPSHAAWKPPLSRPRRVVREIGFTFITAGIVVLLFVVYQLWGTGFAEAKNQNRLKTQFAAVTSATSGNSSSGGTTGSGDNSVIGGASSVPVAGPPEGSAVAHLVIPKIGVDKYVVQGVADADLSEGPGHYPGTPLPGEPGNAAIAGHRTTYGAPFYDLNELVPGDDIFVTTKAGQFHYTVEQSMVVKPSDVGVIGPTADNRLTLTTCNPRFSSTSRLIVVAELTSLPVTPPSTVAPVVVKTAAVNLGSGNNSAWPPAIEFGLLFVAVWAAVRIYAAMRRNWRWVPFVVGIPLSFIPLWFLFENVIRLLPNNI